MNPIMILTALAALLTGLIGGTVYNKQTTVPTVDESAQIATEEVVVAADYVSLRPALVSLPAEELTTDEKADLLYMREEEKLARDVYQTLYEKWNLPIFSNIAQSEQTHTEAIRDLLEKYNLTDPVTKDEVGVFQNEDLQALYTSLSEKGLRSEIDALNVGSTIEDLDIKDLIEAIERTDNQDIKLVYENLMRGSRNHLRAFTRQLTARGETYEPQYIEKSEYENILWSETERGGNQGHQGGKGRGWGGR